MDSITAKWDSLYQKTDGSLAATVLIENSFLLPEQGTALDMASGLGANALFLASRGLTTQAWDISTVALTKLDNHALQKNLLLSTRQLFISAAMLPKNTFDVIVISRFLDRSLCNAIIASLKADGLLFYQTYVREKIVTSGPKNPDFLLARNELLTLFSDLNTVYYRENSVIGDIQQGERNEAQFIGQKPSL